MCGCEGVWSCNGSHDEFKPLWVKGRLEGDHATFVIDSGSTHKAVDQNKQQFAG